MNGCTIFDIRVHHQPFGTQKNFFVDVEVCGWGSSLTIYDGPNANEVNRKVARVLFEHFQKCGELKHMEFDPFYEAIMKMVEFARIARKGKTL